MSFRLGSEGEFWLLAIGAYFLFLMIPGFISDKIKRKTEEDNRKLSDEIMAIWESFSSILYSLDDDVESLRKETSIYRRVQLKKEKLEKEKKINAARALFRKSTIEEKGKNIIEVMLAIKSEYYRLSESIKEDIDNYLVVLQEKDNELQKREKQILQKASKKEEAALNIQSEVKKEKKRMLKIYIEITRSFPFVADVVADHNAAYWIGQEKHLKNKKNPALKGAEAVKEARKALREAVKEKKQFEYKIKYYEHIFPWIVDYFDAPLELEAIDEMRKEVGQHSSADYSDLSKSEKFQLHLDRYWARKKTNWEIGRDYERYVGYKYEIDGWSVSYWGAIKGLEDMGRDLIAVRDGKTEVIQCKRWAQDKVIHEKHVFQLFGTTMQYAIESEYGVETWEEYSNLISNGTITPVFITSATLSPLAEGVASALGIKVLSSYKMEMYPCIKCHAKTSKGDKIYHLPFDQQYDRIKMDLSKGDSYVLTVAEAEKAGFRRAMRWRCEAE